jgi:hypothetical protein
MSSPFSREAERAFRYAALSSGLEIVRQQIERSNRREQDFEHLSVCKCGRQPAM